MSRVGVPPKQGLSPHPSQRRMILVIFLLPPRVLHHCVLCSTISVFMSHSRRVCCPTLQNIFAVVWSHASGWIKRVRSWRRRAIRVWHGRSEEHTSELQSLAYLVCRLLLEKKKNTIDSHQYI